MPALRRADHLRERMDRVTRELDALELYWRATAPEKTERPGYGALHAADVAEIMAAYAFRLLMIDRLNTLFAQAALADRCEVSKRTVEEVCGGRTHRTT